MSHGKNAPTVPQRVEDEAGETPAWVPGLGVGLLVVIGLLLALRAATESAAPAEAPTQDDALPAMPAANEPPAAAP